jgi:signal transduction histidine kinase
VPLSLIDNLFVSVVSTKGSRGTGLGLPVVYKIAKEHGGTVVLDTEMGSGATFRVFIPRGSDNDLEDSVPASEPS